MIRFAGSDVKTPRPTGHRSTVEASPTDWIVGELRDERQCPRTSPGDEVMVYKTTDGEVRVDVRFDGDMVWLIQHRLPELFGLDRSVVPRPIRNDFGEKDPDPKATSEKFSHVRFEVERTVSMKVDHYNLDVIVSVSCRLKSPRGAPATIGWR